MSARDFQRKALYDAESEFEDRDGHSFSTIREAQLYANKILESHTFLKLSPNRKPVIIQAAAPWAINSWVEENNTFIKLSSKGMTRTTVVHEMAHVLTTRLFGARIADHAPEFCSIERMIIQDMFTKRDALLWEKRLLAHGVRFNTESVLAKIRKPHSSVRS